MLMEIIQKLVEAVTITISENVSDYSEDISGDNFPNIQRMSERGEYLWKWSCAYYVTKRGTRPRPTMLNVGAEAN